MKLAVYGVLVLIGLGLSVDGHAQKKKGRQETQEKTETPAATPPAEAKPQQQAPQQATDPVLEHYYTKYTMAARWNDDLVAKDALYDMIIRDPKNDSLIFTLAYFYYENQQYAPSMLVCQELLARDPKNMGYLELSAASFEAVGILDRALQNYETLYLLSDNTTALYKIAFLQYDLKRYAESQNNTEILLTRPDLDKLTVGFNDEKNNPKDYPMKVAIMNLQGLISEGKGDKEAARKIYQDILKLAPDFQPAKVNLAKLK